MNQNTGWPEGGSMDGRDPDDRDVRRGDNRGGAGNFAGRRPRRGLEAQRRYRQDRVLQVSQSLTIL